MQFALLLYNIEKNTNLGQIIRTANAFGALEICVIGKKKFASYGHQQTRNSTHFRHFFQFSDAQHYYKNAGFDIVGVEITEQAVSINEHRFEKNTVFVLGNESSGIQDSAIALCDYCVYIPQFGVGASINVNVACGIVLNAFMHCSGNTHNQIVAHKFAPDDDMRRSFDYPHGFK